MDIQSRLDDATEAAIEAFWAEMHKAFPEVDASSPTTLLDDNDEQQIQDNMSDAAEQWVRHNVDVYLGMMDY